MKNKKEINYNLANVQEIKSALALRLELLEEEKKALDFMTSALASYTKKRLNKYFKDHCEALSPTYNHITIIWNSEKRQEEKKVMTYPLYNVYIEKGFFNKITLYIARPCVSGWVNKLYFTFYGNNNAETEEEKEESKALTPENLALIIKGQQESLANTIAKIKSDHENIEALTSQYNIARQSYNDILESVHFYTRDQLTGERNYNLSKNN